MELQQTLHDEEFARELQQLEQQRIHQEEATSELDKLKDSFFDGINQIKDQAKKTMDSMGQG